MEQSNDQGYKVPEYWRTWQLVKLTGWTVDEIDEIEEAPGGVGSRSPDQRVPTQ